MVEWQDGTLVSPAHVNEDGTITPAVYEGATPLSAYNLNKMQNDLLTETQKVNERSYTEIITTEKSIITLPFYYKVGEDMIKVYYNGRLLIKASSLAGEDGHYVEVGEEGTLSNQIQCNNGWTWLIGTVCMVIGRSVVENVSDDTE